MVQKKRLLIALLIAGASLTFTPSAQAAEKLKIASPVKLSALYYIPTLAGEEGGFWKQNGLEAELVAFSAGAAMFRAVAAGEIKMGFSLVPAKLQAAAAGIPVIIVCDLAQDDWYIWVSAKSRFKEPKDLKGAKVGVSRFGGTEYAYGRVITKALGLEKEVKFVSTGGIPESLAALKTQIIDGVLLGPHQLIKLKVAGEVRELVAVKDFRPKEWVGNIVYAHKGFVTKEPEVVRRAVRSILQGLDYTKRNPRWAMDKMKEVNGYSEEEAKMIYQVLDFTHDGKISKKGLDNVRSFLIEYGIVAKEKAPPVEEMYTDQFTG